MNTAEKNEYIKKKLGEQAILREGKEYHEYNDCLCNYPERPKLAQYDPLNIDLDYMLGIGNAGFRLELIGYGMWETVLLKMIGLPLVWIFVKRPPDGQFLDPSFEFSIVEKRPFGIGMWVCVTNLLMIGIFFEVVWCTGLKGRGGVASDVSGGFDIPTIESAV